MATGRHGEDSLSTVIIDPATGGVAGLYLNAYRQIASDHNCTLIGSYSSIPPAQKAFFYKRTDLAAGGRGRFGFLRLPLRYLELLIGLIRSFIFVVRKRPRAVMYALSSNLLPELVFIFVLRVIGFQVFLICHDVVPFVAAYENRSLKDLQRRQFYKAATKLICHNKRSIIELTENYGICSKKIIYLPFPILDLRIGRSLLRVPDASTTLSPYKTKFLFIGHVRPEKGVDVLLKAWQLAAPGIREAQLLIAGQIPYGLKLWPYEATNIEIINRYIDECNFIRLIQESDVVVLPYVSGTNSGILSSVISLGRRVILSDLDMFKESGLSHSEWEFESGNSSDLASKICSYAQMNNADIEKQLAAVEEIRDRRIRDFSAHLDNLFTMIERSATGIV